MTLSWQDYSRSTDYYWPWKQSYYATSTGFNSSFDNFWIIQAIVFVCFLVGRRFRVEPTHGNIALLCCPKLILERLCPCDSRGKHLSWLTHVALSEAQGSRPATLKCGSQRSNTINSVISVPIGNNSQSLLLVQIHCLNIRRMRTCVHF